MIARISLTIGLAIAALRASAAPPPELPVVFAAYQNWNALLAEPNGPHAQRYIRVYARDPAKPSEQRFPAGSVIAKEKLLAAGDREPEGVAFMVRHAPPEFPESGGWEFLYFPASGDRSKTQEACASCHRAAGDFVFGEYPKRPATD